MSFLINAFVWLFRNWRSWLGWVVRIGGALIVAWGATEALYTMSGWLFGNMGSVFGLANDYITSTASAIRDFTQSIEVSWIAFIADHLEIEFFVTSLIGWGSFVFLIIEYTLLGAFFITFALVIKLLVIKWKQKQAALANIPTGGGGPV